MVKAKDNIKLVPKLRFPGFKGEWEEKHLREVISEHRGGASLKPSDFTNDPGCEVIPKKAIGPGGKLQLSIVTPTYCSPDFFAGNTNSVIDNSYLVTTLRDLVPSGPIIGYIVRFKSSDKYILAQGVYALKVINSEIHSKFLVHFSNKETYRKIMQTIMVGSTQVHIRNSDFFKVRICLPPLPEQKKIASFLSAVDKKIQQLTARKELLEQYKKGVMQKIFSQEIRFTDDNGKDYPDWQEKKLGDVLTFISTNSFSRKDLNYESGEIKNIHYGDIHTTFKMSFDAAKENVPYINKAIDLRKVTKEQFCQVGDVVIADASEDYNDIGKAIEICDLSGEKIVAGLHTFLGRDKTNQTSNGFKGYLLKVNSVRKQIQIFAQGISVLGISKTNLAKVKFQLPCKEEQIKIVTILKNLDKKIESVQSQLTKTQTFKKGLLQQLFV